jgi:hypothetical protein
LLSDDPSWRTAPASTSARTIFSFMVFIREQLRLFGDLYADPFAVLTDQEFDHVGITAVIQLGGYSQGLFHVRIYTHRSGKLG